MPARTVKSSPALNQESIRGQEAEWLRCTLGNAENLERAVRRHFGEDMEFYESLRLTERLIDTGRQPDLHDVAKVAVSLCNGEIRDAIEDMTVQAVNTGDHHGALVVWSWLTVLLPDRMRWRAAALTAYAAWVSDHTGLASQATNISLSLHPAGDNRIAAGVRRALNDGVRVDDEGSTGYAIGHDED